MLFSKASRAGIVVAVAVFGHVGCSAPPSAVRDAANAGDATMIDAGRLDGALKPDADAAGIDATPGDAQVLDAAMLDASGPDGSMDSSVGQDAAPLDASSFDAKPLADAAVPDALVPDAGLQNLYGIELTDVTDQLPERYLAGRPEPDPWGIGSGAAIGDVNGDGYVDVVLARCDYSPIVAPGGPTTLLLNQPFDPGFESLAADADFSVPFLGTCAHSAALGDYDSDGDLDLFVAMSDLDRLLENDGNGQFTDVTNIAGVAGLLDDLTSAGVWADVNRDGLLDLYVSSHTNSVPALSSAFNENRLYLNQGDGSFLDVALESGASGDGSTQTALIADLDNDGDLEILVINDRFAVDGLGANVNIDHDIYLDSVAVDDSGIPEFTDRSVELGLDGPRSSMGASMTDLDEDGNWEIYISDWGANHLFRWNQTLGIYEDVAAQWGLALSENPQMVYNVSWGSRFVDFDRDGREELLLINGYINQAPSCSAWSQLDRVLARHPSVNVFFDITGSVGLPDEYACPPTTEIPLAGRGAIIGDLDHDGDDDLIVTPFDEAYRFYRNDTSQIDRHRVRVRPIGTVSSPDPVGALLAVQVAGVTGVVRRVLYGGGDTFGQSDRVVEIGIGDSTVVEEATLTWPSGLVQRIDLLADFAIDTTVRVVEPEWLRLSARVVAAGGFTLLTYRPVDSTGQPLGAAGSGRVVVVSRSDGLPVDGVNDDDSGVYTVSLPHPNMSRTTWLSISVDGAVLAPRLTINFQ